MTKLKKAMTAGSSVLLLLGSCVYCYILLNILSSEAPTNMSVPLQPVKPRVKHDVTPEMELAIQRMEGKPAPEFSASDGQNVMHRLATELIRGPIVLVFIKPYFSAINQDNSIISLPLQKMRFRRSGYVVVLTPSNSNTLCCNGVDCVNMSNSAVVSTIRTRFFANVPRSLSNV